MFRLLVCLFFACATTYAIAQNAPDCRTAFPLNGKTEHTTGKVEGFGGVLELKPCGLLNCIGEEHNSYWYRITPPSISTLTMEIIPKKEGDIVHFMFFKADLENYCSIIANGNAIPLRTNISSNSGAKGFSMEGTELFIPADGENYNKAVDVIGAKPYYLVVDHPSADNDGHSIELVYETQASIGGNDNKEPEKQENNFKAPLEIRVKDKITGQPLAANFEITGIQKEPVIIEGKESFVFGLEDYRSYTIKVNKKGYLFYAESIVTSGGAKGRVIEVELAPFNEGDKVTIDNIYFKGDDAELLATSGPALQALAKFMQENPDIEIEIGGHVNAKRNSGKAKKLSKQRAESVFYSLVLKDVPKARMSYKGYGNTEMKFPDPQNESESAANRRVEIKIIKK